MTSGPAPSRAAIVDPFSSGNLLAAEFARCGVESIAVLSSRRAPEMFRRSFRKRDFARVLHFNDDLDWLVERLRRLLVRHVVPGCDIGLELADALAERLGAPGNGTRLSGERRDKYDMIEVVRAHGLEAPDQVRASSVDEMQSWAAAQGRWPVIVKPLRSTASDGVFLCHLPGEIATAHGALAGRTNALGLAEPEVLGQEFLPGVEYAVDTVSCEGHHRLAAVWRYRRPDHIDGAAFVCYDGMDLLPTDDQASPELLAYVRSVLDALEIRHGPAHTEVVRVDGRGPVLVEVSARLNAGNNAVLVRTCGGRDTAADLTVRGFLAPEGFLRGIGEGYTLTRRATTCFLMPRRRGRLRRVRRLDEIRALRSFHRLSVSARVGRPVPRVVGAVTLIHRDREIIEGDVRRIRELEAGGLYDIWEGR